MSHLGSSHSTPLIPSPPDIPDDQPPTQDVAGAMREGMGTLADARIEDAEPVGNVLRHASVRDCMIVGVDWANADASGASLTRVEIHRSRLTGAILVGANLRDVVFADCRLDLASLRFAELERVRFEDCRFDEADLSGAKFSSASFARCALTGATLAEATFARSELRGCDLDRVRNAERLRGVTMPLLDVVRSANVIAEGLGIRILDEE